MVLEGDSGSSKHLLKTKSPTVQFFLGGVRRLFTFVDEPLAVSRWSELIMLI